MNYVSQVELQGYVAHDKHPTPEHHHRTLGIGLQWGPRGLGVSYERGTPVRSSVSCASLAGTCGAPSNDRGTSVIRNSAPLGPCSWNMSCALWWSQGGGLFLVRLSINVSMFYKRLYVRPTGRDGWRFFNISERPGGNIRISNHIFFNWS